MFDAPIGATYVWTGLSLVGVVLAGFAVGLPTAPPPNAAAAADAVDAVAASPYPSTAEHPTSADSVRVGPRRIALRNEDGTTHATVAFGPIVPADDGRLGRVLAGVPPDRVYGSPAELAAAARTARDQRGRWRPAGNAIRIRKVSWGDVDVTLVGA